MDDGFIIRPYRHSELAILYAVSWKTMKRWLDQHKDKIGPKIGQYYSSNQVKIIFKLLGLPKSLFLNGE